MKLYEERHIDSPIIVIQAEGVEVSYETKVGAEVLQENGKLLWQLVRSGGKSREWEDMYRKRWSHDKVVRTTHGVNCTGSCSWKVFVKNGIITWENQQIDYPSCGPDMPEFEPRGCPRGASFSWYEYSPLRVKYPYMRGRLWHMWKEALNEHGDPIAAWASIVEDPAKSKSYKQARGKGGHVRVSWQEATKLIAAQLIYTIRQYGPDRIAGFTPIPAMSMISYASGQGSSPAGRRNAEFYDWYADLPPASRKFGESRPTCRNRATGTMRAT